jgi:hypothetical protein
MNARITLAALLLLTLVACGDDDRTEDPWALEGYPMSSLGQVCDDALTGQDVLDTTRESYSLTLRYLDRAGTTPLDLGVAYEGGPITCYPHWDPPPGSTAPSLAARVTVVVRLTFTTEDGALRESFPAGLESPGTVSNAWVRIGVGELAGSYDPQMPGYEDVTLTFDFGFDGERAWGTLIKGGRLPGKQPEAHPAADWGD